MSMFRRLLIIAKLSEQNTEIILAFENGEITLNHEGKGNNITLIGSEVILN